MNTMKEANDQQKEMALKKKIYLLPVPALLLCLILAACGSSRLGDTGSSGSALPDGMEPVTDMAFLDGTWSIAGTTKLYFDSKDGYYIYRGCNGLGGRGEFSEVDGRPMIEFNGFFYDFLLRDDGVLLPNQNGEGDGFHIDHHTFQRDGNAKIIEWETENWDGMWQNALGETIVINTSLGEYAAYTADCSSNGTIVDAGSGMGFYLYEDGANAYLCPVADGNSFTLAGEYPGRYSDDEHFDGVFYRNGDFAAYTDLENAEFYYDSDSQICLWYHDGVNDYYLGDEYSIGDDGLAYHDGDGLIYPAGWIPEKIYDPAKDWGTDWMNNWGV
mgnify:CR=1 FL=1